jgi:alpha-beta hydrolase superfamily lysophospholipase
MHYHQMRFPASSLEKCGTRLCRGLFFASVSQETKGCGMFDFLLFFASSVAITALIPAILIVSQPRGKDLVAVAGSGLDFSSLDAVPAPLPMLTYRARDGVTLNFRYVEALGDCPLIVMIHGSGWHGQQYDLLAAQMAAAGVADVAAPDLRGHGAKPQQRGHIAYVAQLEDDIADLIAALRKPGQKVVLLGHSSGGGLVVRFAGGKHGQTIDAAILLAPYLGDNAPTARPNSGGWAQPLMRRIIGLSMLNAVGVKAFNAFTTVKFRFPASVLAGPQGATATRSISFAMMSGYAPRRNFRHDLAALPRTLLIVGADDEAFIADQYAPLLNATAKNALVQLVPDCGHLGIVNHPVSFSAIADWLITAQ